MQCEEARNYIPDYLIDDMPEPIQSGIEQHLIVCESCRAEMDSLGTIWMKLGTIPATPAGPDLRKRFEAVLEAYMQGVIHRTWWHRQPILQFGCALVLLIAGIIIGYQLRPMQSIPVNSEIAQLRSELHQVRQLVALSLLQQQSASDRLMGVSWSYQLQPPGREILSALLDTLKHDQNINVRLAAMDALGQFAAQPIVRQGIVEALVQQDSPMVQIALIDLLVDLREKDSVGTLRTLTENQRVNVAVRDRAQKGLMELE
jgi:Putative zinc-finger